MTDDQTNVSVLTPTVDIGQNLFDGLATYRVYLKMVVYIHMDLKL